MLSEVNSMPSLSICLKRLSSALLWSSVRGTAFSKYSFFNRASSSSISIIIFKSANVILVPSTVTFLLKSTPSRLSSCFTWYKVIGVPSTIILSLTFSFPSSSSKPILESSFKISSSVKSSPYIFSSLSKIVSFSSMELFMVSDVYANAG